MHTAEDHVQLIGFPAVGDGQHDIIFGHDAQIAMHPSTGWRKIAWVPVLVRVATIFLPISPDLPIPVTITRPLDL